MDAYLMRSIYLGQKVDAADGPCGEVADIIIDPVEVVVTHLVVEPHQQHHQARLVPIAKFGVGDSSHLALALTQQQLRGLPEVCSDDFVHPGAHLHVGGDWDVGIEEVSALPYWDATSAFAPPIWTETRQVTWDRIPKGECEIRRRSQVIAADGKPVGHVEGFVADGGYLVAVIVKSYAGLRRSLVIAPMSTVARIRTDRIELNIDRAHFKTLQPMSRAQHPRVPVRDAVRRRIDGLLRRGSHPLR